MDDKICYSCKEKKPVTEFYPSRAMKGGSLNMCSQCCRDKALRSYHERMKDPAYRAKVNKSNRERLATFERIYISRTLRAVDKARQAVEFQILIGKMQRSGKCDKCGAPDPVIHHHDLDRPLEFEWLCVSCDGLATAIDLQHDLETTRQEKPEAIVYVRTTG